MKISKKITVIDMHTAGEAARLITDSVPRIYGKTMAEKREYFENNYDDVRKIVMHEPRGHNDMFGAFITEPVHDEADYGIIFMDTGGYLNMCGHNTIAAMTAAVEQGWVEVEEGNHEVKVVQDTPAGIVCGTAYLDEDYSVSSVSFENVDAFLYKEGVSIDIPDLGKITIDISFGGSFFALIDAKEINMGIGPENSSKFSELGMKILKAVNEQVNVQHPTLEQINTVDLVEFYGPAASKDADYQNVVVFGKGSVDRSPCGTGTTAKLAALYSKGEMGTGDKFVNESILKTKFTGEIIKKTEVGEYNAIIPRISGAAFITGYNEFLVDPKDPLSGGFILR